jgi:uncharacterized protein YchJ
MAKRKPIEHEPHVHGPDCDHGHEHEHFALPIRRSEPKVGRNDPCPCGSGKKYKKCCGASA